MYLAIYFIITEFTHRNKILLTNSNNPLAWHGIQPGGYS